MLKSQPNLLFGSRVARTHLIIFSRILWSIQAISSMISSAIFLIFFNALTIKITLVTYSFIYFAYYLIYSSFYFSSFLFCKVYSSNDYNFMPISTNYWSSKIFIFLSQMHSYISLLYSSIFCMSFFIFRFRSFFAWKYSGFLFAAILKNIF